eukprot:2902038-Ditylum_brightwellii.AAC.2
MKKKENAAMEKNKMEEQGYKQGENIAGKKVEEKIRGRRDAAGRYQIAQHRINSFVNKKLSKIKEDDKDDAKHIDTIIYIKEEGKKLGWLQKGQQKPKPVLNEK